MEEDQFGYSRKTTSFNQVILRGGKYCMQSVVRSLHVTYLCVV